MGERGYVGLVGLSHCSPISEWSIMGLADQSRMVQRSGGIHCITQQQPKVAL